MISVAIMINGNPIMARSAVNIGKEDENNGYTEYLLDDGSKILHKSDDGAIKLAKMMLDSIKEQT